MVSLSKALEGPCNQQVSRTMRVMARSEMWADSGHDPFTRRNIESVIEVAGSCEMTSGFR
jgi:hypothetical protein